MLRRWLAAIMACLVVLGQAGAAGATEVPAEELIRQSEAPPPQEIGIKSYGPGDRIAESDEEFVADSGYPLDSYIFRSGGPIVFPIAITRYFGPVDGNGRLLHPELIEGQTALLTLRVWDVDQDYAGPDFAPEVDIVSINGHQIGMLTGADGQWSTFTAEIPLEYLRFPDFDPATGVIPAENIIQIDIDTANVGVCECWAVEVDWGRLVIKGVRPAVLVHGFLSSASTWDAWVNDYAPDAGLPVYTFSFDNNHGSWLAHAREEAAHIARAKQLFGVDKLNVVGHSKGGLDTRAYLALGGGDVERLIMLGTPNAGSPLADIVKLAGILWRPVRFISLIGEPALTELTVTYMQLIGNQLVGPNPATEYYTVAGDWTWRGFSNPLIWGPDDGVVAVSSVEALPYTISLGRTSSFHTDMTSNRDEWNLASGQVLRISQAGSTGGGVAVPILSELISHEITGGTQSHEVLVSGTAPVTLGILWGEGDLNLTLTAPSGAEIRAAGAGVEMVENVDETLGLRYILYRLEAPESGTWQLNVTSSESGPVSYLAIGAEEGGPTLSASSDRGIIPAGDAVILTAEIDWAGAAQETLTVTAHIERPDGEVDEVVLEDDGAATTFAATYTPEVEGYYNVAVAATGTGGLRRFTLTGFQVLSGSDNFTGQFTDTGVDDDWDGLYNRLQIDVEVAIGTPGEYLVTGELTDESGRTLTRAAARVSLGAGQQAVVLDFDGLALGESGFSGDLILTNLALIGPDGSGRDFLAPAAAFSGYDPNQFQRSAIRVLPGITDSAHDLDGDGKYDELRVEIPVDVLRAGYYNINARLMDQQNQEIAWDGIQVYLNAGESTVTLTYPGEAIGQNGVDGPYLVRDFSFYGPAGQLNVYELHSTFPYQAREFAGYVEPAPDRPTFESILAKIDRFEQEGKITPRGIANALRVQVENAQKAWERGQNLVAQIMLRAVVVQLDALSGKLVDAAAAQELINDCEMLIEDLEH